MDNATPAPANAVAAASSMHEVPANPWNVLCVDDEPNIGSALRRLFRGSGYRVLTAESAAQALSVLEAEPVDLIISDMRMPGMDGAQLLEQVRARWPAVTRLLLTGYADVQSTVAAINRGEVYRYITKPWNDAELLLTVREAFEHQALRRETRRLEALTHAQNAELKELNATLEHKVDARTQQLSQANDKLRKNYLTSIKVFSNLIELRGGQLVGHSKRVAELARRTARELGLDENAQQDIFIAGLLHDVGQIGLSDSLLTRPVPRMSTEELTQYRKHSAMGEQALMALDDMQPVAALIRAHHERHDGKGFPDGLQGDAIPLGARILSVADTFDDLQSGRLGSSGLDTNQARTIMSRGRGTLYDPEVIDVFLQVALEATPGAAAPPTPTSTAELRPGMVLARELVSAEGVMLLAAGQVLNADLIQRVRHYERRDGLTLVLHVKPQRKS